MHRKVPSSCHTGNLYHNLVHMIISPFSNDIAFFSDTLGSIALSPLHPEEENICATWKSAKRINEFRFGRMLAHQVIRHFDPDFTGPLLQGERGEPLWPNTVTGSLSHSETIVAAAGGLSLDYYGIGLDIENAERSIDSKIGDIICTEHERERCSSVKQLLSLFSAKEAFYKAVFPVWKRYIAFRDVELEWIEDISAFVIRKADGLKALPFDLSPIQIHSRIQDACIVSSIAIGKT